MERIRKKLKKIDPFGENFTFKYNDYDKYSTSLGGLVGLIFGLTSLVFFILNLTAFFQRQSFTSQFYTINLEQTEDINLNKFIAFGIDCRTEERTNKTKDLFNVEITYKSINDSGFDIILFETKTCENTDFDDEFIINNTKFNYSLFKNFQCLNQIENKEKIHGDYTDSIISYYIISVSAKEGQDISEINDFLFESDCKLQFFYTDIAVDIDNYKKPIKPIINSLFLPIIPHFI